MRLAALAFIIGGLAMGAMLGQSLVTGLQAVGF